MATSSASLATSPKESWVEKSGGLPPKIRQIARALMRENPTWTLSRAIAVAVSQTKKNAAKGSPRAVKPAAQWAALKARNAARQTATSHPVDRAAVLELSEAVLVELARRVRTDSGARRYGKPIGSLIGGVRGPHAPTPRPSGNRSPAQKAKDETAGRVATAKEGLARSSAQMVVQKKLGSKAKQKTAKATVAKSDAELERRGKASNTQARGLQLGRAAIANGNREDMDAALGVMGVGAGRARLADQLTRMDNTKALRRLDVLAVQGQIATVDKRAASGQITTVQAAQLRSALRRRLVIAQNAARTTSTSNVDEDVVELSQPARRAVQVRTRHDYVDARVERRKAI